MYRLAIAVLTLETALSIVQGFSLGGGQSRRWVLPSTKSTTPRHPTTTTTALYSSTADDETDEAAVQWDLLQRYHTKGSWKGVWSTFDYMGDMVDETIASVDLNAPSDEVVQHTHTIVVGAKRSDCATCFDAMDTKTLPVATYTPDTFRSRRPIRLASRSWVNGPTVLRSGAVATEVILAYNDGRVRAVFQHAPVWPKDVDTSGTTSQELPPPQGLKLFRVTVSREALRDQPPTAETETTYWEAQEKDNNNQMQDMEKVVFYRPVPPFNWHKVWSGTSWTWGPSSGNRGWAIEAIEDGDDWHGSSPVEAWNMRLPGGLFLQSPRMITPDNTGLLRLAWMPNDEVLLRVEAGVLALQPMELKEEEDLEESAVFAFEPPSLASLRCDVLKKTGDLEGEPQFAKDQRAKQETSAAAAAAAKAAREAASKETEAAEQKPAPGEPTDQDKTQNTRSTTESKKPKDGPQTIGDVLQL